MRVRIKSSLWQLCLVALAACSCSSGPQCTSYTRTTIASLRSARGSGCFELSDVVLLARTPSASAPRVYLQDRAGGDFSALMAKCSDMGAHPCPLDTQSAVAQLLDGSAVTARGYYQQGSQSGFEELYLDSLSDNGSFAMRPAPVALDPTELAKDARKPAVWFQTVRVDIPAGDPWLVADMSPTELALGATCPRWSGFAMIPASRGAPAAGDCVNGENPPTASPAPDGEILIGRQFYDGFWASSDCACAVAHKQHLISSFSTLTGPVRGVLILEQMHGFTVQVFEPLSKADFPISGG